MRHSSRAWFARLLPDGLWRIAVLRNGKPTTMDIAPEARDSDDIGFPNLTRDFDRQFHVLPREFNFDFDFAEPGFNFVLLTPSAWSSITPLSDQLAAYFGVKQGVLVSDVAAGSAGEMAGLEAGDVITTVKGQAVSSSDDVVRELREAESGTSVEMRVVRDRKELTLTAKMPERTRTFARRGGRAI